VLLELCVFSLGKHLCIVLHHHVVEGLWILCSQLAQKVFEVALIDTTAGVGCEEERRQDRHCTDLMGGS